MKTDLKSFVAQIELAGTYLERNRLAVLGRLVALGRLRVRPLDRLQVRVHRKQEPSDSHVNDNLSKIITIVFSSC